MSDSVKIVSISSLTICFVVAILLMPDNETLWKTILGALFALIGIPGLISGIRTLRRKEVK